MMHEIDPSQVQQQLRAAGVDARALKAALGGGAPPGAQAGLGGAFGGIVQALPGILALLREVLNALPLDGPGQAQEQMQPAAPGRAPPTPGPKPDSSG
jgi:hypothetical protein